MRSSIKKNLVIIVEQEQQVSPVKSTKFQKFSPKPQSMKGPIIPSYQTPMSKQTQSQKEIDTANERKGDIFKIKSSEFSRSQMNLKNLKMAKNISEDNEKSLSEKNRRLFFISKDKTCQRKKCCHQNKLNIIMNKVKKVLKDLEELVEETYAKFGKAIQEMGRQFAAQLKYYSNFNVNYLQKVSEESEKIRNNLPFQVQIPNNQKINGIPLLDLQKINDDTTTGGKRHYTQTQNTRRQVQTQRNSSKNFGFACPTRVSRKFSAFNQTLNRIKRLSFEGTILKL